MSTATTAVETASTPSRGLNIGLWVVQVLLALMFGMAGVMKSTTPVDQLLANGMTWVNYTPEALVRFIGVSELLGGIGLILPAATRIAPKLTGVAAAGLATIMVLAMVAHATHDELGGIPVNVVLGALAGFVAWGRLVKAPISAR